MLSDEEKQKIIDEINANANRTSANSYYQLKNPETGKVLAKYPSAQAAFSAGAIKSSMPSDSSNALVYKSGSGWTQTEPYTSSVSLDKKTGNITLRAPQDAVNSKEFQESDFVKQLKEASAAYKANPNATLIKSDQEGGDTEKTITIPEYIESLNELSTEIKDPNDLTKKIKVSTATAVGNYYANIARNATKLGGAFRMIDENGNIRPIEFSEADLTRLSQNGLQEGTKETDRIALPRNFKGLEKAYKAETWDEETATIEIQDFMKNVYNLDKYGESESGEHHISNLFSDLERYLAETMANPTNSESVDKDKITGAMALYNYMKAHSPSCNFWTGATYAISAPLKGIAGEIGKDAPLAFEAIMRVGGLPSVLPLALANAVQWLGHTLSGASTDYQWMKPQDFYKKFQDAREVLEVLPAYVSGNLDKDIADAMNYLNKDIADEIAKLEDFNRRMGGTTRGFSISQTSDAISAISGGIYRLVEIVSFGNTLEKYSSQLLSGTATKASLTADKIIESATSGEALVGAAGKLVSLLGAETSAGLFNNIAAVAGSKVVSGSFALVMETIGEGLVQDPDRLQEVLAKGMLSEDGVLYVGETLLGNAIGGAVGVTVGKTAMTLGQTTAGRIISAKMRNQIYKIQTKVADSFDAFRLKTKGYPTIQAWIDDVRKTNPEKADALTFNRLIRAKKKELIVEDGIKLLGKDKEEIIKILNELDEGTFELMALENAVDNFRRQSILQIRDWQYSDDNPLFKLTNQKLTKLTGEIMTAEKASGLVSAAKTKAGALFSQATTNYIGASVRVPILQNVLELGKKTLSKGDKKAIAEEIAHWTQIISDYKSKATPELLNLVQTYTTNYRTWWGQANNIFINAGTIDPDDIEAWRKSGQWGENGELYARLQRRTELDKYFVKRADGLVDVKLSRELGHYGWGATDDFVDPQLVMQQELRINADIKLRNDAIRAFSGSKGPTVIYDAAHTKLRTKVAPLLEKYNQEAKITLGEVVNTLDQKGMFQQAVQRHLNEEALIASEREGRQIARQSLPKGPVTPVEQQTLITVMSDSQIDSLFGLVTDEKNVDDIIGEINQTQWGKTVKKDIKTQLTEMKARGEMSSDRLTTANIAKARAANPDLDSSIKRAYLANDERVASEPYVKDLIQSSREEVFLEELYASYNKGVELQGGLKGLIEAEDEAMGRISKELFDEIEKTFFGEKTLASIIGQDLVDVYGSEAPDVIKRFIMLDAMQHNRIQIGEDIQKKAFDYFSKVKVDGKPISATKAKSLSKRLANDFKQHLKLEFDASRAAVAELGDTAKTLVDAKTWQREVRDQAKAIGAELEANNRILMRNKAGEFETIEIDPLLAEFVGTKSVGEPLRGMDKVNYMWMRLFRMGTTGISPRSMLNQYFRDLGNAWILGNVNATIKTNQKILGQVFGDNVAEVLAQYSDEAQDYFQKLAKEQRRTVGEVVAESEIARGRRVAEAGTETADMRLYRETRSMWYEGGVQRNSAYDKSGNAIETITDKAGKLNEVRETYLRDLVYSNNYTKAINEGKTIEQARTYAEYIANNATTNFVRQTTFLSHLQRSIPYLRSSINGTKSFWRLWSLDPVGVTSRLFGGYIIPTIGLISASMNGEENLKVYKNIPEYRKENALPLVIDGQYFSIPIPQELSALINPVRHAIEAFNGMHKGAGLEIVLNDIFAFSPLDLGGFTDIDSINMLTPSQGMSWAERLFAGGTKLLAGVSPKWLSAAASALTGRDLYTGKKIDTSYVVIDPETGATQQISYTAGVIANKIAEIFPNSSAAVAQEVLNNIFGDATVKMLDWIVGVCGNVGEAVTNEEVSETELWEKLGDTTETFTEWVTAPIHPYIQDETDKAWRAAVSELWDKKYALLMGDEWQAYIRNRTYAKNQTERDAAAVARANILNPFYDEVKTMVDNLTNTYGDSLTPARFASVISLMNIYAETGDANVIMQDANSDAKQQGKNAAVDTMIKLGFSSTSDSSVWGSVKTSAYGGTYVQYATPLQILDWTNMDYNQGKFYAADLSRLLKNNNITSAEYQSANNAYKAETDKEKKKALAIAWDTKVAAAIAPYVQQYGANQVINADAVLDLLDYYLIIPSDFMKYKGKSTYNPNVEIKRGYARNLLKAIFKGVE